MKQLLFESSPAFVVVCLIAGIGFAFLLYSGKHPWGRSLNRLLFAFRAILVFCLSFLLLGPIVKQINNIYEKPLFIILQDNSVSIQETSDSVTLKNIRQQLEETREALTNKGYEVKINDLAGEEVNTVQYTAPVSDFAAALKRITNRYEGRKVEGVIFLSDGIYNTGVSPLYASYGFPIYAVGVGDTSQRVDLSIKNIAYNKIVYQGNKFPVRVEVLVKGLTNQAVTVSVSQHGNIIEKQSKNSGSGSLVVYNFQVLAKEQGIQKLDVQVEVKPDEQNVKNNRASVFVEVVEGKKKILLVASSPHPDIKALREVINQNSNYEFLLHIPGLSEQPPGVLKPDQVDLAIFYQSPDIQGKTRDLFKQFATSKTSLFVTLGQQSDLLLLSKLNMPFRFITLPRDYDEVTPVVNPGFSNFALTEGNNSSIADYPPVSVHFGKMQMMPNVSPILFQRLGSVTTEKPLLAVAYDDVRKIGILSGEGIWRWRLHEFDRTEKTIAFDELFGKLFQYLSTTNDKRKFRSYPIQQEFSDTEPMVFESQVYNDLFEPVYGNTVELELTTEKGKKEKYSYVINPGNIRYQVGGLKEGVYRFKSKTILQGKPEEVKGEFAVVAQQAELQNLTADFDMLRKLSANTGGKFYELPQLPKLKTDLQKTEAKSMIHTEERYNPLINLKWIFFMLLMLICAEWFLRKYYGSY